jgi:hypothetical protein
VRRSTPCRITRPPLPVQCAACGDAIHRDNRSRVSGDGLCVPCRDGVWLVAQGLVQDQHEARVHRQEAER